MNETTKPEAKPQTITTTTDETAVASGDGQTETESNLQHEAVSEVNEPVEKSAVANEDDEDEYGDGDGFL